MIIDVHCHYAFSLMPARATDRFSFEPGRADEPSAFDSYVSPRATRRFTWRLFKRMLGLDPRLPPGDELDQQMAQVYERHFLADGPVERIVLLAFDEYHDDAGRRPGRPSAADDRGTDIYSSNSLIRDACRRRPERYLFGASVHPYRERAVACVEEVFAHGACLLKWLPLHQNIDIADPRTLDVMRCCASLGLPVLVHFNSELTLTTQHPEYESVTALLDVLRRLRAERAMPLTIVAHAATPVTPFGDSHSHRVLIDALMHEFADAPLYADLSALTSWGKLGFLRELAERQDVHPKLLFGTDFPVPMALLRLRRDLGRAYASIAGEASWIQRIARIHRQLGFNEIVFHRAAELLPNVDFFAKPRAVASA